MTIILAISFAVIGALLQIVGMKWVLDCDRNFEATIFCFIVAIGCLFLSAM